MEYRQFAILVRDMRDAQRKAASSPSSINRERASKLQAKVDAVINTFNLPKNGQVQNQTLPYKD